MPSYGTVVLAVCFVAAATGRAAEATRSSAPATAGETAVLGSSNHVLEQNDSAMAARIGTTLTLPAPALQTSDLGLWYVLGDGGSVGSSATYSLAYTTGQAAVGQGSSGLFELHRGFWQNFNTSCCVGTRGNLDMAGIVDVSDLCKLVTYLMGGEGVLACVDAGNVTGTGIVDIADLSALIDYLTGGGYVLPYCP